MRKREKFNDPAISDNGIRGQRSSSPQEFFFEKLQTTAGSSPRSLRFTRLPRKPRLHRVSHFVPLRYDAAPRSLRFTRLRYAPRGLRYEVVSQSCFEKDWFATGRWNKMNLLLSDSDKSLWH
jgi:hypothetical protein